jgi:hypothetical protein
MLAQFYSILFFFLSVEIVCPQLLNLLSQDAGDKKLGQGQKLGTAMTAAALQQHLSLSLGQYQDTWLTLYLNKSDELICTKLFCFLNIEISTGCIMRSFML